MHTYCTLFDIRYLARGLALYHSLVRHARPFELWVLCLDLEASATMQKLALEHVRLVSLAEIEAADPALLDAKGTRTPTEYYYTLTPAWTKFVLSQVEPGAWVSYVDADLLFYSSPDPMFEELANASVGIIPHRFPERDRHMEKRGRYNVGLVAFRNDDAGNRVAADWRVKCLDWCYDRVDETGERFADQKYLDAWPERFEGVHVITHPGAGVGPWNWMTSKLDVAHEPPRAGGAPLIFYHFHRFRFVGGTGFASGLSERHRMPKEMYRRLYAEYARELEARSHEAGVHIDREPIWLGPVSVRAVRRSARILWGLIRTN